MQASACQEKIETGDIDAWPFTANAGASIVMRMGLVTFISLTPKFRLFPYTTLFRSSISSGVFVAAAEVSARATNSGTFMVVAGDFTSGWTGTGNYRISLAKTGGRAQVCTHVK